MTKQPLLYGADYAISPHVQTFRGNGLKPAIVRHWPRHPVIAKAAYRLTRWLGEPGGKRLGFHRLGSEFATRKIASIRERLQRGETVYIAGLAAPGTHNTGIALIEVTQQSGPRIVVNNEEERFSGKKHTTDYPRASIDAMVATLRQMGRDVSDIAAFVTTWDYPAFVATMIRTMIEEAPGSFRLLTMPVSPAVDRRQSGPDAAHLKNSGPAARPARAHPADLHAASRQPCLVFVRRLSLCRRFRARRHRGDRRHRRPGIGLALSRKGRRDAPPLLQRQRVRFSRRLLQRDLVDPGRLDLAVERGPLHGRCGVGRHEPRHQSLLRAAEAGSVFRSGWRDQVEPHDGQLVPATLTTIPTMRR